MKTSYFVTLEGIEGVGKSTHLKFIEQYLQQKYQHVVLTREPGGTPVAEAIRHILLAHHDEKITQEAELLLLFAARSQHIHNVILPALAEGKWVICDRFIEATYAYQGYGRGMSLEKIMELELWVQKDLYPDRVLLLDAPVSVALGRISNRTGKDRIEIEEKKFFERVREGYLIRAEQYADRYTVIDAAKSIEEVQEQIRFALDSLLTII
jgi:dTMP kinase